MGDLIGELKIPVIIAAMLVLALAASRSIRTDDDGLYLEAADPTLAALISASDESSEAEPCDGQRHLSASTD
jgi:hypothetical protein